MVGCIGHYSIGLGQTERIPIQLVLFESLPQFNNASLHGKNPSAKLGNQSQFGAFSEIRQFYGIGSLLLNRSQDFGMSMALYSMSEGQLINEYRAKLGSWKQIKVNDNFSLCAGGQIGLINARLSATRSTAGGSSWVPDIDFGLTGAYNKGQISLSGAQLTKSEGTPLSQTVTYTRFWILYGERTVDISSSLTLIFLGDFYLVEALDNLFRLKSRFIWNDRFHVGVGYGTLGPLWSIGLTLNEERGLPLTIELGYQSTLRNDFSSAYQPFQLHFSLPLKKK